MADVLANADQVGSLRVDYSHAKPTAAHGTSGQQLTGPGSFDPVDGDYGGWLVGLMVPEIGISGKAATLL